MITFSAKRDFQEGPDRLKAFRVIVDNPLLKQAIHTALVHYQDMLTQKSVYDMAESAAYYHKLTGAREFVGVLLNLAEVPPPIPKTADTGNLNHKV